MFEKYRFNAKQTEIRLDNYLARQLPNYSRTKIQEYIKSGDVTVDGKNAKPSMLLQGFEEISCQFEIINKHLDVEPEKMDLDIVYEDKYIAIINKPSGLVVHPGNGNWNGTLLNGLLYHFDNLSNMSSDRAGIVHRLDKETSGLIIIAKDNVSHENISKQFSDRIVKKEYFAFVWGNISGDQTINKNIIRHKIQRQMFTTSNSSGRKSITHLEIMGNYPPFTFVKLFPETGRTHQIRVHLKSINNPIVNDMLYGGLIEKYNSYHTKYTQFAKLISKNINRVALHAHSIMFKHPKTNKEVKFISPLPEDMSQVLGIMKKEYE